MRITNGTAAATSPGSDRHRGPPSPIEYARKFEIPQGEHGTGIHSDREEILAAHPRGMHYIGFYAPHEQLEQLRIFAFGSRPEKQDIMRKGMEIVLKRYGV